MNALKYEILRTGNYDVDNECSLCLDKLDKKPVVAHAGEGSKHPFHFECIKNALLNSTKCPYCKKETDGSPLFTWKDKVIDELKLIAKDGMIMGSAIGVATTSTLGIAQVASSFGAEKFSENLLAQGTISLMCGLGAAIFRTPTLFDFGIPLSVSIPSTILLTSLSSATVGLTAVQASALATLSSSLGVNAVLNQFSKKGMIPSKLIMGGAVVTLMITTVVAIIIFLPKIDSAKVLLTASIITVLSSTILGVVQRNLPLDSNDSEDLV